MSLLNRHKRASQSMEQRIQCFDSLLCPPWVMSLLDRHEEYQGMGQRIKCFDDPSPNQLKGLDLSKSNNSNLKLNLSQVMSLLDWH